MGKIPKAELNRKLVERLKAHRQEFEQQGDHSKWWEYWGYLHELQRWLGWQSYLQDETARIGCSSRETKRIRNFLGELLYEEVQILYPKQCQVPWIRCPFCAMPLRVAKTGSFQFKKKVYLRRSQNYLCRCLTCGYEYAWAEAYETVGMP